MTLSLLAAVALLVSPTSDEPVSRPGQSAAMEFPALMTPAGEKFVGLCSDAAFADARDEVARRNRCERLLAGWRLEASRRLDDRIHFTPGIEPQFLSVRSVSPPSL